MGAQTGDLNFVNDAKAQQAAGETAANNYLNTLKQSNNTAPVLTPVGNPVGQSNSDDYFDVSKFDQLLNRLESSKGRQQRQKSVEGRRDIFGQGLASMMSNF